MATLRPGPRLLLVDDDRGIRDSLQALLELEGYSVDTAENGRIGLQRLRTDAPPALIVLDLQMPVMDGAEFRREQLADPQLAHIPVVVCSAVPQGGVKADKLKAAAYFRKPLDIAAFLATVHAVTAAAVGG